jgi:glyceraldehyde 3-phosphate dehydrogenase
MKIIAINGFGRIGRFVFRALMKKENLKVVAVNDLTDVNTLYHLLAHDSVHGKFPYSLEKTEDGFIANGNKVLILSERDPEKLPWKELNVDLVIESTGVFRKREQAAKHLKAGAKKVIISAPAKDKVDATVVMGVNHHILKKEDVVVSNASCTTNCLAPIMKVLNDNFNIKNAFMTTVHSYTMDQRLLDFPHSDLRRARAAALNIIPTTTGAAKATGMVIPELQGIFNGISIRVPTPDGSLVDVTVELDKETTAEEINSMMKAAAEGELKGIVEYSEEPLVSTDIVGNPHSSIFDGLSTMVQKNTVKLLSWYDNEWGYSNRVADLAEYMSNME